MHSCIRKSTQETKRKSSFKETKDKRKTVKDYGGFHSLNHILIWQLSMECLFLSPHSVK